MKKPLATISFILSLVAFISISFVTTTPNTYTAWIQYQHDVVEVKIPDWETMKLLEIKNNANVLFYNGTDFVKYADGEPCSIVRYENNRDGKNTMINLCLGIILLMFGVILSSKKDTLYDWN